MNIEDIVIGKDYEYMGKQCKAFVAKDDKVLLLICVDPEEVKEANPYKDFKIDEPVMVRNADNIWNPWRPHHFAGVNEKGEALAWRGGCTSWTAVGESEQWDECRKPTEEELKIKGGAV